MGRPQCDTPLFGMGHGKILNKPKIVNALGTKVMLNMFYFGPFSFLLLFKTQMVFFAKPNLNGFLCGTYSCYTKFVTYHAIPILIEWNGMPCPMHVNN
jgi:hypothetical protein